MKKLVVGLGVFTGFALLLGACGGGGSTPSELLGVAWQWTAMQETVPASQSVVPDPENYTITFNDDGTIEVKADCNTGGGSYSVEGSGLTISLGSMTMAYCGDDSADQVYLGGLAKVASYALDGGSLQLNFADDAGKMDFRNGGAAP